MQARCLSWLVAFNTNQHNMFVDIENGHICSVQYSINAVNSTQRIPIHPRNSNGLKLWSGVHTFGYLLNQEYQDDPKSWSRTMCDRWAQDEDELEDFVDNLIPCPCTLQQAIVDTGRFQPDTGCSMYAGSVCTYHQGAEHCVRSVAARYV